MPEWIWINGETLPLQEARIGVEDRGYQFSDGVYEVIRLYNGRPFTLMEHLERLQRSARDIRIETGVSADTLASEIRKLVTRSEVKEGMVYLQLTRGVAARNHVFPQGTRPTILFYVRQLPPVPPPGQGPGAKLHSVPDERWKRCWIKSIALLPNVLAKNAAVEAGADEAVFLDDGIVTECSASNIYFVIDGRLHTHCIGPKVLPGITRAVLLECAARLGIEVIERCVREEQAKAAGEIFISSTTREISWVSHWDGKAVGGERCGPTTQRLHEALVERVHRETA